MAKPSPSLGWPHLDTLDGDELSKHFATLDDDPRYVPTPLPSWNTACRDEGGGQGLARGWHVVIGAGTGVGKSLLGINLAARALYDGQAVGFMSLEMSKAQLQTRLYSVMTGAEVRRLERGPDYDESVANRVVEQITDLRRRGKVAFWVNEGLPRSIDELITWLRDWIEEYYVSLVIVDYLQLAASRRGDDLFRAVSELSTKIRDLAYEKKIVTVGLSQLNRSVSSERDTKPIVQGLMASSSVENDADQVVLLDHSRRERDDRRERTWLLLAKNRHGASSEIPILWDYKTLRVREALPDEEDRWP